MGGVSAVAYHLSHDHIRAKIKQNWGLERVFRWAKGKYRLHGESLILGAILLEKRSTNQRYPERTVRRVINSTEERLPAATKRWLLLLAGVKP